MARRGEEALVIALAVLVWAAVTAPAVAGPLQEAQWQQAQAQAAQRARLLRSEEHLPSEARASPRSAPRASLLRPGAREIGHTRALRAVEVPRLANGGARGSRGAAHFGVRVPSAAPPRADVQTAQDSNGDQALTALTTAGGEQVGVPAGGWAPVDASMETANASLQSAGWAADWEPPLEVPLWADSVRNVTSWQHLGHALADPSVRLVRIVNDIELIATTHNVSYPVTIRGACGPKGDQPCVLKSENSGKGDGDKDGCLCQPPQYHRAFEVMSGVQGPVLFEGIDFRCFYLPRVSSSLGMHGGVALVYSSTEFRSCNFRNSLGTFGGAIQSIGGELTLVGCNFTGNAADRGGAVAQWSGAITVHSCIFENSSVSGFDAMGGSFYFDRVESVSVWDSSFTHNKAKYEVEPLYSWGGSGGALYACMSTTLEIGGCSFRNNSVTLKGDDLYMNTSTLINRGGNTFNGQPVPPPGSLYGASWADPPPSPPPSPPAPPPSPPAPPSPPPSEPQPRYVFALTLGVPFAIAGSLVLFVIVWPQARRRLDGATGESTTPLLGDEGEGEAGQPLRDVFAWSSLLGNWRGIFEELPIDESLFESAASAFSLGSSSGAPRLSSSGHSNIPLTTMIPDSRAWDVGRGGEGVVRAVIVKGSRVLPIVTEDVQALASSERVSANNKECVLAAFKEHDTRTRLAEDMQDLKMLLHAANKCRNAAVVLGFVTEPGSSNCSNSTAASSSSSGSGGGGSDSGSSSLGSGKGGSSDGTSTDSVVSARSTLSAPPLPRGFVSQLYPLCDLSRAMRSGELVLTPRRICDLLLGVAQYLGDLHDARFAHRDLKPANVLLTCDCDSDPAMSRTRLRVAIDLLKDSGASSSQPLGSALRCGCSCMSDPSRRLGVAVCDVGMARAFHAFSGDGAFTSGHGAGTLTYLAPERFNPELTMSLLREGGVSQRSARLDWDRLQGAKDLWCLGAIGWELLNYYTSGSTRTMFEHLGDSPLAGAGDPVSRGVTALMRGVEPTVPRGPGLARASAAAAAVLRVDPALRPSAREVERMLSGGA